MGSKVVLYGKNYFSLNMFGQWQYQEYETGKEKKKESRLKMLARQSKHVSTTLPDAHIFQKISTFLFLIIMNIVVTHNE